MASILFLIWSSFGALLTINVFHPPALKKHRLLLFFLFLAGLVVGDLALHWVALNAVVALLFYWNGAFDIWVGQLALAINVASWGALLIRFKSLPQLHLLLQQQMQSELAKNGADATQFTFSARPKIDWKAYWNPFSLYQNKNIEIIRDVTFYTEGDLRLRLDIYRPKQKKEGCPVLLQIHGGGWSTGAKNQAVPLMVQMAEAGWVCFAISYRLTPPAVFPDHLIDCKRAIWWIKEHGSVYGADPNFIVTTGGSAGGHLAALVALTQNQPQFQPGFESCDTQVHGCIGCYGVYDFEAPFGIEHEYPAFADLLKRVMRSTPATNSHLYRQASPIHWVTAEAPPFLLIHGEQDVLVNISETERFYKALKEANARNVIQLKLPLIEHAFDIFPTIPTQCLLPIMQNYLESLYSEHQQEVLESTEAG